MATRIEIVRRCDQFEPDPEALHKRWAGEERKLRPRIEAARERIGGVEISDAALERATRKSATRKSATRICVESRRSRSAIDCDPIRSTTRTRRNGWSGRCANVSTHECAERDGFELATGPAGCGGVRRRSNRRGRSASGVARSRAPADADKIGALPPSAVVETLPRLAHLAHEEAPDVLAGAHCRSLGEGWAPPGQAAEPGFQRDRRLLPPTADKRRGQREIILPKSLGANSVTLC